MAFGARDVLAEASVILRAEGSRGAVLAPARSLISEAVYQVGQAIYGRNSHSPKLVREGVRSALALVLRARKLKGAPAELGTVATLLQTALRSTPRSGGGDPPPGLGRMVEFHGAYKTKADAVAKERKIAGAYVQETKIKGQVRYAVLVRRPS